jgi:hypothetical protein
MASFARVVAHSKQKGLTDEQPFMLGAAALRASKGDWAKAYSKLREQANRFALKGDVDTAEVVTLAARIVRFYGQGY